MEELNKKKEAEERQKELDAAAKASQELVNPAFPRQVVIHPLVLLSTVDHFLRVNPKGGKGRVVGVLLGEVWQGRVDVTNSFAVPFDEDEKSEGVWYLDHDYLEKLSRMFKKVAAKEKIVGWYSTGPQIRPIDIQINHLFRDWGQGAAADPVFCIIDVNVKADVLPTEAYVAVEGSASDSSTLTWSFQHIACEIGALEAEEIGVEHLLRDIKDTTISTLSQDVDAKVSSLRALLTHLQSMAKYLRAVASGELPVNHAIIYRMQDIFNLLPNTSSADLQKAFATTSNDMMVVIYLSSLIRAVIALHNLVNNKLENRSREMKDDSEGKARAAKLKELATKTSEAVAGGS
jgi:26S proteasome regulatory subunit N8